MSSDTEEYYRKLLAQPGVVGLIVVNTSGIPIKSTLDQKETLKYVALIVPLVEKTRTMIRELVVNDQENNNDDLTFLRLKSRDGKQILISPESDYIMVVIQSSSHLTNSLSKQKQLHTQETSISIEQNAEDTSDYNSKKRYGAGSSSK